jgi:YgiT-type zinc finger domain-containing protein
MKCVVCHGENIEAQEVKEPIEVGSDLLYVTVTTRVCQTCGERYYDRKTMQYLETVEAEVRAGSAKVREVGKVLSYG